MDKENKYHMLLDHAVYAFFQGDRNGNIITANEMAAELTGYSNSALLSMNFSAVFTPESLANNPLRYDLLGSGQALITERDIKRKDGKVLLVEMHSKVMPDGTYQSIVIDISKRRLAESALIESEIKYKNLHMSMMDGYVYVNMNGEIRETNSSFQHMVGYSASELTHLTYVDLTPLKWHEFEKTIVRNQILTTGHSMVYQKEYIKKDGTVFPVELRTFLIRDTAGNPEGMWAIVRDITERRHAEEEIRRSEERYRRIVESSPNGMHIYDLDHDKNLILTGANPAADTMLGIAHTQLIGKRILEAFPNLAGTEIPEIYIKVALGETSPQSFEIPYIDDRFSGYYSVHVFRTSHHSITVNFTDITRRRKTEEALQRSEIEYRDTLDSLPDWIYVVDEKSRIAMVNQALKFELTAHGMEQDCIGKEITIEFPFICERTLDAIKQVFITGVLTSGEQELESRGRVIHAELTRVPIFKDGRVVKVILMIRDRSKEHEIEEFKRRSADQKEVLLREIHHRVKNNLAIVISLLNFQMRNNPGEELSRMILDIQMRIRSMALIHEHLYRSESLDRIPLANYIESLAYMILTAFSGHRINLEKKLDAIDVSIETALPIGLIINELLTNAFKYAFPGNTPGNIMVTLAREEGEICSLVVEDNGIGLPDALSMNSEKSLGLYIVNLLVEQLDGSVKVVRNNGTSFQIRFRNLVGRKD